MVELTRKKREALLEQLDEIVDNDKTPWTEKRDLINATAKDMGERYENALEEFLSWFPPEEE